MGKARVDEITAFISRLPDFPKIGTIGDDLAPGLRAIPAPEKAVVCFTVDDLTRGRSSSCASAMPDRTGRRG